MEGFGILRAQFKDLADFDAADDFDGCAAVRAFVAGDHVADGRDRHVFEVPRRIDVLIVIAGLIGTGDAVWDVHSRRVDEDEERFIIRFVSAHGAHVARLEAVSFQVVFRSRFDDVAADEVLDSDIIDFMVAADHAEDRLFAINGESDGFNRLFDGDVEELGQVFNSRAVRRFDEFYVFGFFCRHFQGLGDSLFDIGCIVAFRARYDFGFSGLGQGHELVRMVAADLATVGFDRLEVQAAARKDARISIVFILIALVQAFFIDVEGIGVFHDEFTAAHEAETRADFVAVLILHLPQRDRHLLVRTQLIADQGRNQFFMGRAEAETIAVAVFQFEHFRAISIPAARFMPDFSRLHNGHHDFLSADVFHFFANDGFDFEFDPAA